MLTQLQNCLTHARFSEIRALVLSLPRTAEVEHTNVLNLLSGTIETLEERYDLDPSGFKDFALWGQLLVLLGGLTAEEGKIEEGLARYAQAEEGAEVAWAEALGWEALYSYSTEWGDLQKALECFQRAAKGIHEVPFFLDYGRCLRKGAHMTGDPSYIQRACDQLRAGKRLLDCTQEQEEALSVALLEAHSERVLLTHSIQEGEQIDRLFQETIAACPTSGALWLRWGEVFLRLGWSRSQPHFLEGALEKFTALKIADADPIVASSLLSEALMALGVLLDNHRLFSEGKERVRQLTEEHPHHRSVRRAIAFSLLASAFYFVDAQPLPKAIEAFTLLLVGQSDDVVAWEGLFEAYFYLGVLKRTPLSFSKALTAAQRLIELRPYSALYQIKEAECLIRLSQLPQRVKNPMRLLEQAIQRLTKIQEEGEALFLLGCAWDMLGEITGEERCYNLAIKHLEKIYAKLPTDVRVTAYLGLVWMHRGKHLTHSEALFRAHSLFEKVLKQDRENGELLVHMGLCKSLIAQMITDEHGSEEKQGWYREAEEVLKQAVMQGEGKAFYPLASLYSLRGLCTEAMQALQHAEAHDALPPLEELEYVSALETVRNTEAFQEFLSTLRDR